MTLFSGTLKIVVYNNTMRKYLILIIPIILSSCVYYGSGIKTVTGSMSGGLLTGTVKVGLFSDNLTFLYDNFTPGDPDKIYQEKSAGPAGSYTPIIQGTVTSSTYTITFPDDPSIINCLIAWDDVNTDGFFDLDGSEIAYLPVKTINNELSVITNFTYIEEVKLITYIVNHTDIDLFSTSPTTIFPNKLTDNFDAIGAGGFDFVFD